MRSGVRIIIFLSLLFNQRLNAQQVRDSLFQPTVLLELFSSEGCSSCPYADEFMQEIMHIADSTRSPVAVLDYHVDIWDRSGWKDRYSDSNWTKRMDEYRAKVGQPAQFTPMIFVNGQHGLPAGAKKEVGYYIAKGLEKRVPYRLGVKLSQVPNKPIITVSYTIDGKADSMQLVIVVAEKEGKSIVTAGENAGKTLVHHNIVRRVETTPVRSKTGAYEIGFAYNDELSKYTLVVYLQHVNSWKVLGTQQFNFR